MDKKCHRIVFTQYKSSRCSYGTGKYRGGRSLFYFCWQCIVSCPSQLKEKPLCASEFSPHFEFHSKLPGLGVLLFLAFDPAFIPNFVMYLQLNSRAWCLRVLGCQLCCLQVYQCGTTIWMLDVVCYFKNCLLQWVLAVALIVIGLFSRWLHTAIFQYITPQIRCLGDWVQKLFVAISLVIGSNTATSFFPDVVLVTQF